MGYVNFINTKSKYEYHWDNVIKTNINRLSDIRRITYSIKNKIPIIYKINNIFSDIKTNDLYLDYDFAEWSKKESFVFFNSDTVLITNDKKCFILKPNNKYYLIESNDNLINSKYFTIMNQWEDNFTNDELVKLCDSKNYTEYVFDLCKKECINDIEPEEIYTNLMRYTF